MDLAKQQYWGSMSKLNDVFNVDDSKEVTIVSGNDVAVMPTGDIEKNADYDYEMSRGNLHSLLYQGQDALMHALEVAKQSEHPRAFEVVGNLIKQMADINHQLIDLSNKRQKLTDAKQSESGTTITNNTAYFVGSTAELNKMLSDMNKEK
jgi:hypothetical protein